MNRAASTPTMAQADLFMRDAMEKYLRGANFGGWYSEHIAGNIVRILIQNGNSDAIKVEPVLLPQETTNAFKKLKENATVALYQQLSSTRELEEFEKEGYASFIQRHDPERADLRKRELTKLKEDYIASYTIEKQKYEDELIRIKQGASKRMSDYMELRADAFVALNDDPVVLMNRVLTDVNRDYPEYAYAATDMHEQVQNLYGNYQTDVQYLNSVHSLLTDLSDNLVRNLEKKIQVKERKQEIQDYYQKKYNQQIFLVQLLIFFSLFVIVGSLLLHYQIMNTYTFVAYVGLVFSVAFVVFFYYLWDFYMRDTTVFDEYQFDTYLPLPNSNGKVLESGFKDNIIYC
jgi:lipopolysaccharide export LptBFGC system permease protein LptF